MSEREPSFLRREPAGGLRPPGAERGEGRAAASPYDQPREHAPTFMAAGFWRRLGGGLIDLAVLVPITLLLVWLAGTLTGIGLPRARYHSLDFWLDLLLASDPALLGAAGMAIAIALIYALVFQLTTGRTIGMWAVRVRVIDLYGDPPSTARALIRCAGYLSGVATLGLGFLWVAFDAEKRGLHDVLAGTFVVRT
jgi:uncharacterized RDD family membrane protein YckC